MMDWTKFIDNNSSAGGISSAELLPLVYEELRLMAAHRMSSQPVYGTLQSTALVHEAWLKMASDPDKCWENRSHFFKTAASAMRSILVDRARRRATHKMGHGLANLQIDECQACETQPEDRILMIDQVLDNLEKNDPDSARIVTMKFFGGLTNRQIAEIDGVAERTIERQWAYARSCLFKMIRKEEGWENA